MKTLFRILIVCFILLLLACVAGYFVVTNAGFQKRILESKLPVGSSVKHVHVTSGALQLSELNLVLPDGTRIRVSEVDTTFSPLAALFDQTIRIGALEVDGLVVQLPAQVVHSASATEGSADVSGSQGVREVAVEASTQAGQPAGSPWESINAISNLEWLLDIETIKLNGKLKDAAGTTYAFDLKSGALRPSTETVVDASLTLVSSEALQSGLKEFDSQAQLRFTQKASGGFEQVHLESQTIGKDTSGSEVLSLSNAVDLAFNSFEETADLRVEFRADVQRPEIFMPELASMGSLKLEGDATARVDGVVMTLSDAGIALTADGAQVVTLDLKQALNLGGKQSLKGELLQLKIDQLPFTWLGPWMPEGIFVEGAPFSAHVSVTGLADGSMEVVALAPVRVGPITARNFEQILLQEAIVVIDPIIRVNADQSITYNFKQFQLLDRYGEVLSGQVSGRAAPVGEVSTNPFAGQKADVTLKVGLQELFQQPLLQDKANIIGGTLDLVLTIDGNNEFPLLVQGDLRGLRARSEPEQTGDYRVAAKLKNLAPDLWSVGLNFDAGSKNHPSTSLQLAAQANVVATPLTFKADLTGPLVTQSDFDVLATAFVANETVAPSTPGAPARPVSPTVQSPSRQSPSRSDASVSPPWAAVNGEASVDLKQVVLKAGQSIRDVTAKAIVSEPLLKISGISAKLASGSLGGGAEVRYEVAQTVAYSLLADFNFKQLDPSAFSNKPSGSFPVRGLFNGEFNIKGAGNSLETSVENSVLDLTITGTNGVLTAFELDNRSQLGLGIAGLLGQQLNRPGITAMAETVPYFKDMKFDHFILELKRGDDRKVMIPQLRFTGESLLIDGSGFIAASSFKDVMDQPLNMRVELGAKGRLTNYLETLQLLKPTTSEDGFRRWNQVVNLSGTLGKPNTSEILDILSRAAKSAFDKPREAPRVTLPTQANNPQVQQQQQQQQSAVIEVAPEKKEETKAEKRRNDIDMGLDLLNTVLGN